jgi:hypothetical protein
MYAHVQPKPSKVKQKASPRGEVKNMFMASAVMGYSVLGPKKAHKQIPINIMTMPKVSVGRILLWRMKRAMMASKISTVAKQADLIVSGQHKTQNKITKRKTK